MRLKEAADGIYGAWMLAWLDRNGLYVFENTPTAFWRSFWAAVLCAPIYIVLVLMQLTELQIGAGPFRATLSYLTTYAMSWIAFPFIMFYVSAILGRAEEYCRYMAAYNWASTLQYTLILAIGGVVMSETLPGPLSGMLHMAAIFVMLIYRGYIARVGLRISAPKALGIVGIDFVLSLVILRINLALLYAAPISAAG